MVEEDKDDESFGGAFEDGQWVWDDLSHSLLFISNHVRVEEEAFAVIPKVVVMGAVQFREIDLIEQMRFRKRYQRKLRPGQRDIISLQYVKDLVIYTAPLSIMSPALINALHLPTIERFLRALIFYCQYYLQIAQEMSGRIADLDRQIRTPATEEIEKGFRDDISDLRCLVTKEYCTLLIGGHDTKKYHHMGPDKKKKSLSDKDARFFESLLLVAIQIVWIALGRRSFNQLELEINRIFKTHKFNSVEHRLKTKYYLMLSPEERNVLLGECLLNETKVYARSPLFNEFICTRKVDYRMFGLGTIKYNELPQRLKYMLTALTAPEEQLVPNKVTVGILGQPRDQFDTVLHLIQRPESKVPKKEQSRQSPESASKSHDFNESNVTQKSDDSYKTQSTTMKTYGYADIVLPEKRPDEPPYPPSFPAEDSKPRACSERQRKLWLNRLFRLTHSRERQSEYNAQTK